MKKHGPIAFLICLIALLPLGAAGNASTITEVSAAAVTDTPISLTAHLTVLEDPEGSLTLPDLLKPDVAARFNAPATLGEAINFGYTRSAFWLRLSLRNDSDRPMTRLLEIRHGVPYLEFHRPTPGESKGYDSIVTGTGRPFDTRAYENRHFVFPISLPAHYQGDYFIRASTSSAMTVPAYLWEPKAFEDYARNDYNVQMLYFGLAAAMALFNLLLAVVLRRSIYFQYVAFLLLMMLSFAARTGIGHEYLWPGTSWWSKISISFCDSIALAVFILLARRMLNSREISPRLDRALLVLSWLQIAMALGIALSIRAFAQPALLLNLISGLSIFIVSVRSVARRQRSAYFFLLAFMLLLGGSGLIILRALGVVPTNNFTVNGMQLGSALEMILLAIALADHLNQQRKEKEESLTQLLGEQAATEKVIRQLATKFSRIFDATPEWLTISRYDDKRLIEVNRGFERATGWSASEAVGRTLTELGICPDSELGMLDAVRAGEGASDHECDFVRKDGTRWRASLSAVVADINDERVIISVVHDVTAIRRKEQEVLLSEQKFAAIFDAIPDAVVVSRARDGTVVNINDRAAERLGRRASELIGRSSRDLRLLARPEDSKVFFSTLAKEGSIRDFEADSGHTRADGVPIRVAMSARMVTLDGEPHVLGISRDITQMHEKEVALQASDAARKAAEAANQMKSEFLAMISHEVRTPLGGVIGMIKFGLRDRGLQAATREKLDLGLANAESLLQIINDILDYSKLEAGKMTLEVMDFDLPKLVRDTVAMLAERAESKGLSLVYEIETDFPQWWHGDPTRLRQVLVNLAGNAIKFTLEGEVRIAVQTTASGLAVTVRDTGIGIAAEALPRLFQKFEQADASTSRRFGGTGLGLAICRSIVEAMGGTITVESTLGVGTTFRMALPLPKGKPVVSSESDRAAEHRYRLNILCAEDGMTNQVILRELVTGMGHGFTLAEDGEAALVALSQADYDLLLLDSRMPRLDGLDVLKALRAGERNVRQPQLAVIAVTANAGKEERERFMAAGAQGFLPKPIDEHALQTEIGRVIEWLIERGHALPVIEARSPESGRQLDAGNTAIAGTGAMSASPAMRQAFLTEGPRLLGELRKALDAGDGATAARSAHSLKGMAGYFASPDLQEHARLAELAADAGKLDDAQEQLMHMQASVERVLAVLGGETAASEAQPAAGSTKALSRDELNALLNTLEQQLARSSLDAETTLATLREGLASGEAAELAAQMAAHLESFDFVAAEAVFHNLISLSSQGGRQ